MAGRTRKTTAQTWIDIARQTLTEEGIVGLKIDRLAKRLGVTRGGFYNNFQDRQQFLQALLEEWETSCRFLPSDPPGNCAGEAVAWIDGLVERLIDEDGYDHHFDMAVREWGRSDHRAAWAVERVDRKRMATLTRLFEVLGYDPEEAHMRARVFYYHQIGYYAIGVRQSAVERRRNAPIYLNILCGAEQLSNARNSSAQTKPKARSRG